MPDAKASETSDRLSSLRVRPRSGLRVSRRAFESLCVENPDLRMSRTARGDLIVMPPAGSDTGRFNAGLTARLWLWNDSARLGEVFDSSAGFTFPNGLIHAPDASWIAAERWASVPPDRRRRFAPIVPDFTAEIASPSDREPNTHALMREYVEQGVRLAWLIFSDRRRVEVYRPDRPVEVIEPPDSLSGSDVLPGFVLDLASLFK